ncbi:T9SS type A sorting domain-containing protein [uncultured Chitinophaga sp.]|uniref:T9SS type A sorting domain-containing protein n=1 Tax=uncultured Chitinophaga sp. TaxID=339340 RepID=UPI0025F56091|nr:T9SS type A sorting domain-containing protein [uncultured Chitinophaga sp.]
MKRLLLLGLCLLLYAISFAQPSGYTPGAPTCWTINGRDYGYFKAAGSGERHILLSFTDASYSGCGVGNDPVQRLLADGWNGRTVRAAGDTIVWEILTIPDPTPGSPTSATFPLVVDLHYFFTNIAPVDTSEHWRFHATAMLGGNWRMWNVLQASVYGRSVSTTINLSALQFYQNTYTPVTLASPGKRHWSWYGTDVSGPNLSQWALLLHSNLSGTKRITTQSGSGVFQATFDSCFSLAGRDTLTNRWLWMVNPGPADVSPNPCDTCGPKNYVPGTLAMWYFNGTEHAYFKAAGNGERHILVAFTGDSLTGFNNYKVEAPQKLFEDAGINWDGRTVRAPGDTVVWEVLTIPHTASDSDVDYFLSHIAPINTAESWRFHLVGQGAGAERIWGFLSTGNNADIFSTTISMSPEYYDGYRAHTYSYGKRNWVWYGTDDTYMLPWKSTQLYDDLQGEKHITGIPGGHQSSVWDSCLSLSGTTISTNRWLWMVSRDTPTITVCDYGGGPAGYVPGTQVNWRFNGRDHGYFRSAVCGERHVLVVFQGDMAYDSTNYQLESPQKMLNDLGINWDGSTITPAGDTISWEVFAVPYNSGYWLPNYATDINHYFANVVGLDTSDHSRFHIAGVSGGVGRMWGFIRNDQSHNSPYRGIYSTTISVATAWFGDYTPLAAASAGRRNWIWHGADDVSGTNPPAASTALFNALSGEKRLTFQAGAGHDYVTVDSVFSLVGTDSSDNRWIWMVLPPEGGSLLRIGDEQAYKATSATPKRINLYPNPVASKLYVDLRSLPAANYRIAIADINGRLHKAENGVKNVLYQADVSGLKAGVYILTVEGGGTREQRKFIKE